MINKNSDDIKICPNCGKKFTKEEYVKKKQRYGTKSQIDSWWKRKKYCSYHCGTEYSAKSKHFQKISTNKYPLEFTTTVKIWKVEKQVPIEIKINLLGENVIFRRIDEND